MAETDVVKPAESFSKEAICRLTSGNAILGLVAVG